MSDPRFAQRETSLSQKSQSAFGSACELRTGKCTKNKTNIYRATSWAEEPLICLFSDLVELLAKITSESASQRCSGKKKRALQNWTKAVVYFARAKAERNGTAP